MTRYQQHGLIHSSSWGNAEFADVPMHASFERGVPVYTLRRESAGLISSVKHLAKVFWNICIFRTGPQALPASRFLLVLALSAHWLIGVANGVFSFSVPIALLAALLGTATVVAVIHTILTLRGRPARAMQTLTAVAGSEVLLGVIALPVTVMYYGGGDQSVAALLILTLMAWNLAVVAHILRHALEIPLSAGVGFALIYTVVSYGMVDLLVLAHGGG